jgi:hypothetical protein
VSEEYIYACEDAGKLISTACWEISRPRIVSEDQEEVEAEPKNKKPKLGVSIASFKFLKIASESTTIVSNNLPKKHAVGTLSRPHLHQRLILTLTSLLLPVHRFQVIPWVVMPVQASVL